MPDTNVSPQSWLVLLPQLPAKPAYLRVKLQRRLQKLGVAAIKNGVYVLPLSDANSRASEALRAELVREQGDLIVFGSVLCAGLTDEELAAKFETGSAGDETRALGRTWVTREDVFVDRMACAWLIRRFIDPDARFRFARAGQRVAAGELAFDMPGAEFGHQGERCSVETLVEHFGLDDPALGDIAEIVHDIDFQTDDFGRAETPGVFAVLSGIRNSEPSDERRLARAAELFDALHGQLTRGRGARASASTP